MPMWILDRPTKAWAFLLELDGLQLGLKFFMERINWKVQVDIIVTPRKKRALYWLTYYTNNSWLVNNILQKKKKKILISECVMLFTRLLYNLMMWQCKSALYIYIYILENFFLFPLDCNDITNSRKIISCITRG